MGVEVLVVVREKEEGLLFLCFIFYVDVDVFLCFSVLAIFSSQSRGVGVEVLGGRGRELLDALNFFSCSYIFVYVGVFH